MPFQFKRLEIPEVILIEPQIVQDQRGSFMETYKLSDFSSAGIQENFVQDNHSASVKGVLRGLHYQKHPAAQGKLVRCLSGKIFDVAVDIRKGSLTFGRWLGVEISKENNLMLYIPPGFAHGFATISDTADVVYKCTSEYSREQDRGILWNDPDLKISWSITDPILSAKDLSLPLLRDSDTGFL